mgnify:FL=1
MRLTNLTIFIIASSLMNFGWGLIGPFYYLYVNQLGGNSLEQFGIAFGIMYFTSALASIIAGKYSDKLGRKPFLIGASLMYAVVIYSYTLINSAVQLYIAQALIGVLGAIEQTVNTSFLGDVTKKSKRGFQIGIFHSLVEMFSGVAIIVGGFLMGETGFKIMFYIVSIVIATGAVVLLALKETVKKRS